MAFSSILPVSSVRSGVLGVDGVDDGVDGVVSDMSVIGDTSSWEDIFIFVLLLFCCCSG